MDFWLYKRECFQTFVGLVFFCCTRNDDFLARTMTAVDELLEDLVIQLRRLSNAKLKSPRRGECYPRGSNGNALRHVSTFVQKLYVLVDVGFLICSDSYTLFTAR